MKVLKSKTVALFVALGLKNADKWNDDRLSTKLGKIKEMVDEDVRLEGEADELLKAVMVAADAGEEFEIENDEPAEEGAELKAPKAAKTPKEPKQADEEKAAAKAAKDAAKAAEKEAKDAEKAKTKEERAAAKAALKGTGEDRVLPVKMKVVDKSGKYEIAGSVLAEFGIGDEITEQMCDRFIELFGSGNRSNAAYYLVGAWKAVTMYNSTLVAKIAG